MITIAVDPGMSGGYAICSENNVCVAENFTTMADFLDEIRPYLANETEPVQIVLEDVPPFVGKNIPSSAGFKLGKNCGQFEGLAMGLQIPCHLVSPKVWQKGLPNLHKSTGPQRKRILKEHALRLYPKLKVNLKTADAILIAHHFLNK